MEDVTNAFFDMGTRDNPVAFVGTDAGVTVGTNAESNARVDFTCVDNTEETCTDVDVDDLTPVDTDAGGTVTIVEVIVLHELSVVVINEVTAVASVVSSFSFLPGDTGGDDDDFDSDANMDAVVDNDDFNVKFFFCRIDIATTPLFIEDSLLLSIDESVIMVLGTDNDEVSAAGLSDGGSGEKERVLL